MKQTKKETTLFEDMDKLARGVPLDSEEDDEDIQNEHFKEMEDIQNKQEEEDLEILENSDDLSEEEQEEQAIEKTQVDFIDDGTFDYDAKTKLNFKIDKVAEHFNNLSPEDLNRFSDIYEEQFNTLQSQAIYNKSIKDQISQKGIKVNFDKAMSTWTSMLDKICDIKMLDFLCDLVKLSEEHKKHIMSREIDKLFGSQIVIPKKDTTHDEILGQLHKLNRAIRKGM